MKKKYPFIIAFALLWLHVTGFAQSCSVSIVTSRDSTQLDCRTTRITLNANATASGSVTYSWSKVTGSTEQYISNTSSITVTDSGLYKIVINSTAGCNASSSIRITKDVNNPTIKIRAFENPICSGSVATLIASGATSYSWQPGSLPGDSISLPLTQTTLFTVTGTAANGCTGISTYNQVVNPLPNATIKADRTTSCLNSTAPKIIFTGSGGKPPYTFYFSRNGGLPTQIVTTTTKSDTTIDVPKGQAIDYIYKLLSVTDGNGCTLGGINQSDTVSIVNKPTLTGDTSYSICNNSVFFYTAKSTTADTIRWTSTASEAQITRTKIYSTATTIKDSLTNSDPSFSHKVTYTFTLYNGGTEGCSNTQNIITTVYPTLKLTTKVTPETNNVCSGSTYTFTPQISALQGYFTWSRPATDGIKGSKPTSGIITRGTSITDTLIDTTINPVDVKYKYTLSNKLSTTTVCSTDTTVTVKVFPVPYLTNRKTDSICSGSSFLYKAEYPLIPKTTISYKRVDTSGIKGKVNSGTDVINDVLINDSNVALKAIYIFTLQAPGFDTTKGCPKTDTVTVTVFPVPALTDTTAKDICSGSVFSYQPASTAATSNISWTSKADEGISGNTNPGNGDISDVLTNDSSEPRKVHYIFTLTGDNGCTSNVTITVTVHPAPSLTSPKEATACSGSAFTYTPLSSTTEQPVFTWTREKTEGISDSSKSGNDSISDTLINTTLQPVKVNYVYILTGVNNCPHKDTITVTVYPGLQPPGFTSFLDTSVQKTLLLCDSSENINFNVISPQPAASGVTYKWAPLDSPNVIIKNKNYPNTVITFNQPGPKTITVTASYPNSVCPVSASQIVEVGNTGFGIKRQKIIKKDSSDNILIYPNNSISQYKWGYDNVFSENPLATGVPDTLPNQVYQFFIPDARFINPDSTLNTKDFYYWVLLHNDNGCYTKVYYNGPFDDAPGEVIPTAPSTTVQMQVMPNPNKGIFEISLKGNMYGNIEAQVYNSAGQLVFRKKFVKSVADVTEKFITSGLPAGVYFLLVRSSDLKQVRSRFIISH